MSRFKNWNPPKFYKKIGNLYETKYGWAVSYPQGLGLGKNVDVGYGTYIQARYGVFIGDDSQIGGGCHIYSYNSINNVRGEVIIGEKAKIGAYILSCFKKKPLEDKIDLGVHIFWAIVLLACLALCIKGLMS